MSYRIDAYLVNNGLAKSRERAKNMIKNGEVYVNGKIVLKPSQLIEQNDKVISGSDMKYVGRGALKLKKALEEFHIDIKDQVCADIGASTGGFTEIMLENGAKKVYAVDVGHDQLDEKLSSDNRVINCEGTNVKNITKDFFDEPVTFMSVDLSFISLKSVINVLYECLEDNGIIVALIKPQFEAGKKNISKKGIVRDKKIHIQILEELFLFFCSCGLNIEGITFSPIKGGSGNIEYLVNLKKKTVTNMNFNFIEIVDTAFTQLKE